LLVTAWDGDKLVGVARSMTDFHYACYLSDLAVDQDYQRQGIGKQLQILTQQQLGRYCKLILIAAPAANAYYGRIGLGIRTIHVAGCWIGINAWRFDLDWSIINLYDTRHLSDRKWRKNDALPRKYTD
jgi:GNAT superfamily N-acetyltransferase